MVKLVEDGETVFENVKAAFEDAASVFLWRLGCCFEHDEAGFKDADVHSEDEASFCVSLDYGAVPVDDDSTILPIDL